MINLDITDKKILNTIALNKQIKLLKILEENINILIAEQNKKLDNLYNEQKVADNQKRNLLHDYYKEQILRETGYYAGLTKAQHELMAYEIHLINIQYGGVDTWT